MTRYDGRIVSAREQQFANREYKGLMHERSRSHAMSGFAAVNEAFRLAEKQNSLLKEAVRIEREKREQAAAAERAKKAETGQEK